ncbi:MAG TPA: cytochrome c3 family protein [Propionibacteriaceae bacterium]
MKRIAFIALTAFAIVLAGTSAAFANFGPHGGYSSDTDACAECHRAHTAVSDVTWTDNQGGLKNALLISDATSMTGFCNACHGDGAPGANTDTQSGYYDGTPTGTNSSAAATLNAGGFDRIGGLVGTGKNVMSSHSVDALPATQFVRWGYTNPVGGASNLTAMAAFTCTDCHDPHGSSNYRLLKDVTNGIRTGGYVGTTDTPDPWVISNEQGYPSGGFKKGGDGKSDVASYTPSYTAAQYAASGPTKSMSTWCAACHTVYAQSDSAYNYQGKLGVPAAPVVYHRHPINTPLSVGTGPVESRALITALVDDPGLPLEMPYSEKAVGFTYANKHQIWDGRGNVTCLTCHRAHGTEAKMSGWAATSLNASGTPNVVAGTTNPAVDASGTNPTFDAALLRYDNRGVCERCHNK